MEAKSIEDNGVGVLFNVFCYNAENGVFIDFKTGKSSLGELNMEETEQNTATDLAVDSSSVDINSVNNDNEEVVIVADTSYQEDFSFILNTSTKKIHIESCRYVDTISEKNRLESRLELAELIL